jgi:ribonuclease P protein component
MSAPASYNKKEKLKSRKLIEGLFVKGRSFSVFPINVFYTVLPEAATPVQAGVGVSARNFKKAVARNRIKRLLRESYRLNKALLHDALKPGEKKVGVFFLYVGRELPEGTLLNEKMSAVLTKLGNEINR